MTKQEIMDKLDKINALINELKNENISSENDRPFYPSDYHNALYRAEENIEEAFYIVRDKTNK